MLICISILPFTDLIPLENIWILIKSTLTKHILYFLKEKIF
jgi:hypothetical protein